MADFGYSCMIMALICAVWAVLSAWLGQLTRTSELIRSGERATIAVGALVSLATLTLIRAFVNDDFSLLYVAQNSNSAQPTIYKITALWGGQAGSLLLWVWILSVYSAIVTLQNWNRNRALMQGVTGTLMGIVTFLLVLLQFVSNPFQPMGQRVV